MSSIFGFSGSAYDFARAVLLVDKENPSLKNTEAQEEFATSDGFDVDIVLKASTLSAADAEDLIRLWNDLPEGDAMRCHIPRHGIQLLSGSEAIFSAAICFECNNIRICGPLSDTDWRTFDAGSPAGKALKDALERWLR